MPEPNRLSMTMTNGQNKRNSSISPLLTLDKVIDFIRSHNFDEYTTKGLIDLASAYPNNALSSFRKNFNLMVQRVRAKRIKDQNFTESTSDVKAKEETRTEDTFVGTNLDDAFRNVFDSK